MDLSNIKNSLWSLKKSQSWQIHLKIGIKVYRKVPILDISFWDMLFSYNSHGTKLLKLYLS